MNGLSRRASSTEVSLILVSVAILLCLSPTVLKVVQAQSCTNPPTQSSTTAWPKNASVTVNIDPTAYPTQGERQAVQTAFTNWQNSNGSTGNGSGVTFSFTFNQQPASGTNTYQVGR